MGWDGSAEGARPRLLLTSSSLPTDCVCALQVRTQLSFRQGNSNISCTELGFSVNSSFRTPNTGPRSRTSLLSRFLAVNGLPCNFNFNFASPLDDMGLNTEGQADRSDGMMEGEVEDEWENCHRQV
ncbi:hypothetical protein SCHPADRAFT_910633 [Schizopora paradoxa]|uniref:Uncharacterized protein n=1 Tax=Schizopora paradoxa TaxID=27342 RepID=A0A0H2R3T7_9AGAM|nr:hypothetical protein SCHPADRAFT_910633 [Schizopora paradoxa]